MVILVQLHYLFWKKKKKIYSSNVDIQDKKENWQRNNDTPNIPPPLLPSSSPPLLPSSPPLPSSHPLTTYLKKVAGKENFFFHPLAFIESAEMVIK